MGLSMSEWQRAVDDIVAETGYTHTEILIAVGRMAEIVDYIQQNPCCQVQDIVAETGYTPAEITSVVKSMVDGGQLERCEGSETRYFYTPETHTPTPTTKTPEKTGDKYIAAYLDAFDAFCDEVMERYDQEVIGNLSTEAMISLYRGFLTALPDMKKVGGRK